MSAKPPFLAFVHDAADSATLKAFAAAHGWPEACVHAGDVRTATQYLKSNPSPELLLVEIPSAAEAPALLDGLADVCDPLTKVITIGTINEYSFYCWLMDIGIHSYLLKPLTQPMLDMAFLKSTQAPVAHASQGKPPGKVIAVVGTRGGVGATTLSLNLAGILAASSKKHIALVDLDPHEGSIALALDIEPSRGFRDALEKPDRIDSLFIERVMTKPMPNLSVLSAEEALHDRVNVHENAADVLIKELRDTFDVVILDIPRHLTLFSKQALKQVDHVILVAELTLLSLRDTLRFGDMMREALKMQPPVIVANRVGFSAKQEMLPGDFEKGAGAKIAHRIVFAPDVFMQVSSDIAAVTHKTNLACKPLYLLAAQILPEVKQAPEAKGKKPFSLFKKKEA